MTPKKHGKVTDECRAEMLALSKKCCLRFSNPEDTGIMLSCVAGDLMAVTLKVAISNNDADAEAGIAFIRKVTALILDAVIDAESE